MKPPNLVSLALQHTRSTASSALVTLHHARGYLSLTPDHLIMLDDEIAPARNALVGSKLRGVGHEAIEVHERATNRATWRVTQGGSYTPCNVCYKPCYLPCITVTSLVLAS